MIDPAYGRRVLILLLCGLFLYTVSCRSTRRTSGAVDSRSVTLNWDTVKDANGYIAQVRSSAGAVILERKVQEPEITAPLPPGNYQIRMAALTAQGEPEVWSDWKDFEVSNRAPPEIENVVPAKITTEGMQRIVVSGKNFHARMKVTLLREGRKVPIKNLDVIGPNEIAITFAASPGLNGSLDLVIENPAGRIGSFPAVITVKIQPKLSSIMLRSAVFPGWGHFYADKTKTGSIYTVSFLLAAGIFGSLYTNGNHAEQEYHSAVNINRSLLFITSNRDNTTLAYAILNNTRQLESYQEKIQQLNTMITLTAGLYLVQLAHAFSLGSRQLPSEFAERPGLAWYFTGGPEKVDTQRGFVFAAGFQYAGVF